MGPSPRGRKLPHYALISRAYSRGRAMPRSMHGEGRAANQLINRAPRPTLAGSVKTFIQPRAIAQAPLAGSSRIGGLRALISVPQGIWISYVAEYDGSLLEPTSNLDRGLAWYPEHQNAFLRRPHSLVRDPFSAEHRIPELADGVLELALTRIVLVIAQRDGAGIERGDVGPTRVAGGPQQRPSNSGRFLPRESRTALRCVNAEARPAVGAQKRILTHRG